MSHRNPWRPAFLATAGWTTWLAVNLATVAGYFVLGAVVNAFFSAYGLFPAPIWLPASVGVVAAMVGGIRLLPGIFLGSFLANAVLFAPPPHVTLIISVTNALGPMLGVLLLRRLRPETGVFGSFAGVVSFLLCTTFLHPAISATGGTLAVGIIGQPLDWARVYATWVNWWLTDSGGTLYLAPSLILWLGLEREEQGPAEPGRHGFGPYAVAVWGAIAAATLFLFLTPAWYSSLVRTVFPFMLVVPLSWVALRMSLRSAYTLVTVLAIVATVGTVAGYGPFQTYGVANPLLLVGTLVVLLAMNVLTIVALVGERYAAQNANRVKSMFLAQTSHELRAPLNAILGFSSIIGEQARGPVANPAHGDYARIIHSSGEHLMALINDLLDVAKIEAGRFELRAERLALTEAIAEAVELVRPQAQAKSIDLRVELDADPPMVEVDPRAFRQILLNLLTNAVKFTPAGGRVRVTADRAGGGELTIRVADTGVGIPADALERVFAPFERAPRAGTHDIEGTGLGLAIIRGLIHLHGGSIKLQSTVGRGTVAIVTLPPRRVVDGTSTALESTPIALAR